jgi:hypothetical protein
VSDALKAGDSLAVEPQSVTGPASSQGAQSVTTNVTNNTVTTLNTVNNYTYGPNTVTVTQTTTGVVTDATTGAVVGQSSSTSNPVTPDPAITCGLPNTPPCKIDETGTPDGKDTIKDTDLKSQFDKIDGSLTAIKDPSGLNSSWGLTPFWLTPGSCHAVDVMSLPAKLNMPPISLDICPLLPKIYTLMDLLWIVWTFGATVAMVLRVTTSGGT